MAVGKRLSIIAREFNVGINTIVEFLHKKGFAEVDHNPNTKVSDDMYALLEKEYRSDLKAKKEIDKYLGEFKHKPKKESISIDDIRHEGDHEDEKVVQTKISHQVDLDLKIVGKIDLDAGMKKKEVPVAAPEKVVEAPPAKPVVPEPVVVKKEEPEVKAPIIEPPVVEVIKEKKEIEHIPTRVDKLGDDIKVIGKIDLSPKKPQPKSEPLTQQPSRIVKPSQMQPKPVASAPVVNTKPEVKTEPKEDELFKPSVAKRLSGPTVVGKIELPVETPRNGGGDNADRKNKKKKRKRIRKEKERVDIPGGQQPTEGVAATPGVEKKPFSTLTKRDPNKPVAPANAAANKSLPKLKKRPARAEVSEEDVQKQVKDTLARLTDRTRSKTSKHRRDKREALSQKHMAEMEQQALDLKVVKVTEFVTANELASLMNVPVNQIISTCMSLGLFVSINQRLDAETISLLTEEYGYKVEFISADVAAAIEEEVDAEEDLVTRPPIVTVMGHVDHGKTSLLDYVRRANVIAGEAGGITQHIGAYGLKLENGRQITFLDTPGHEAFTAMRARGAQVTDIAIIIVAADDNVMPQTVEAINHASAAGVPIVFAINKVDKPHANPEKIKESLAQMNYLVEDWGGKYQSQEISAKTGMNVDALLEKVLLEADLLELKANPNKRAVGSVIESSLDKGRGLCCHCIGTNRHIKGWRYDIGRFSLWTRKGNV
jgi:translation initiation factor IF-2